MINLRYIIFGNMYNSVALLILVKQNAFVTYYKQKFAFIIFVEQSAFETCHH